MIGLKLNFESLMLYYETLNSTLRIDFMEHIHHFELKSMYTVAKLRSTASLVCSKL